MQAKVSPPKTSKQESSSDESSEEESEDEKVTPKKKVPAMLLILWYKTNIFILTLNKLLIKKPGY